MLKNLEKSPFQIAKMRLPWLLVTLFIELIAVFVIQSHNAIIEKVILLAAFMPIISAISINTGLQSAAIVVHAIDTGNVNINRWWEPLFRQFKNKSSYRILLSDYLSELSDSFSAILIN